MSDGKMDLWSLARAVISRWEDASRAVYTSAGRAFSRMFSQGRGIGTGTAAAATGIGGGGGGGGAACGAAAAGAGGGGAGLKRMIWAARREVLEGGRPAPLRGGRAYRDMSVGRMAGLRSASQRAGSSCGRGSSVPI